MTRSRLRNKFLCCRSDQNKKTHNEQRNRCVKPVRNAKKQARSQGGEGGEDSTPARLKQVQFALNRKHAFFDAMS